jgi:hypothetical protein
LTQRELDGYISFDIFNYPADEPKNEPGISINVHYYENATEKTKNKDLPRNAIEKMLYIAKKNSIYIGEDNDKKQAIGKDYTGCLIYYGEKPSRYIFYIPENDTLGIIDLDSEYGKNEYLSIIMTITRHESK